ncbi:MAG: excinuclease ABC subunit UvrA, partial [Lentisphaerae bacterium]|nr:excinuclease ABC subunit UvrA [Lentisphaerota bacterium]
MQRKKDSIKKKRSVSTEIKSQRNSIKVRGARQNNLKNLDIDFPLGEFIVVTGVSGAGKSSLAFDTVYAEGQRRYIETFSSYARMFLERMDAPEVDSVEGIPPAIAIRQINPVRTSRSTVGTMTELNDRLKLLLARRARLFCPECGKEIIADTVETVTQKLRDLGFDGKRILISFLLIVPENFSMEEAVELLGKQGYRRFKEIEPGVLKVAQDLVVFEESRRARIGEAIEMAFAKGKGEISVSMLDSDMSELSEHKFSNRLDCPDCRLEFQEPTPNMFSFNSPVGACETCRGFGRIIKISEKLIVPDQSKSVAEGCIRPFQTGRMQECQLDLMRYAKKRKFPVKTPWCELSDDERKWIFEGEGDFDSGLWWGIDRFFADLEAHSYKMHIRILLSRYREYVKCHVCHGARLKADALNWKLVLNDDKYSIHDIMLTPIAKLVHFFKEFSKEHDSRDAQTLLDDIIPVLTYLCDVGLGYLTLDRQSRTLSGGEVQRINLTQALGSSLVNTLFVLDEPSIGLHPRDIERLIAVLRRLRDSGNTVLVVEHDPDVIKAADRVIEMGPGPGEKGGHVIFNGSVPSLLESPHSVTAPFLRGDYEQDVSQKSRDNSVALNLRVRGAREHNLKNISVEFPLNNFVVVTGVSGSGKSTLVNDVLYTNVMRALGKTTETHGECDGVEGVGNLGEVVLVDQSPIGKTTRSTPGSYVKAFDAIRRLFAKLPAAVERGYSYGDFSFNSGVGRCPHCQGSGFEMVEMQFLSDVYLKCEECDGRRYRKEILDVKMQLPNKHDMISIADVLDLTVDESLEIFAGEKKVVSGLKPLKDVGLGYLRLGQPVPTLSGGEAQRLKLAGYLAEDPKRNTGRRRNTLFILDEPTTGLHFTDIHILNGILRRLVETGNSVIVIEHNIMVMRASDYIIDLGPEGGDAGGQVVAKGTPQEIENNLNSVTGAALRADTLEMQHEKTTSSGALLRVAENAECREKVRAANDITVSGAQEHNLRNINVTIPLDKFTVITGVSGSGKSTLAFDIIFASGQRSYLECLNAYARQFVQPQAKPEVLSISSLPPTVAIEQRISQGGWKSTVATVTEIYNSLRLLFLTLGVQYCPDCDEEVTRQTPEQIMERILKNHLGQEIMLLARLVSGRKGVYKDLAEWAAQRGCKSLRVDGVWRDTRPWKSPDRYKEHNIDYPAATVKVTEANARELLSEVKNALDLGNGFLRVLPFKKKVAGGEYIVSTARVCKSCEVSFEEPDPRLFSFNSHRGCCTECNGYGVVAGRKKAAQKLEKDSRRGRTLSFAEVVGDDIEGDKSSVCPSCSGSRLNPVARAFRFKGKGIEKYTSMSINEALKYFISIKLNAREKTIATSVIDDIRSRLSFLSKVGLGYLSLDRAVPT